MRQFFLSGITDEAADDLEGQIRIIKSLGWKYIEARKIDGINIHDVDDAAFDKIHAALDKAKIRVNCFGSTIANHNTPVDSDFEATMAVVKRAITRMHRLKVPFIRIMSCAVLRDKDGRALADQKEEKRFEQLRKICGTFLDAGISPLHENAFNYGSMSWEHTLKVLDAVPGLKLVFDTGDSGVTPDYRKPYPYPIQNNWEVWEHVKAHVLHIHIKDACWDSQNEKKIFLYPGMGDCEVKSILSDAISSGYSGKFTIEPNMITGLYDESKKSSPEYRTKLFIGYGNITEDLFRSIGCDVRDGAVYPPEI